MTKRMLVDGLHAEEIRVVIADDKNLLEFDIETSAKKQTKSNIFLAKVTRVEPSLQAAFVEYGSERQGFLPFSEIHPDYYQIPLADRQELLREEEEELAAELEAEERAAEERGKAQDKRAKQKAQKNDYDSEDESDSEDDTDGNSEEGNIEEVEEEKPKTRGRKKPMAKRGAKKSEAEKVDTEEGAEIVEVVAEEKTEKKAEEPAAEKSEDATEEPKADSDEEKSEKPKRTRKRGGRKPKAKKNEEAEEVSGEVVDEASAEMEELGEEDPHEVQPKRKKSRRYKIQEVIKKNQIILIQVIKEERGNKGASVTSYISLPGRYCVLMPNSTKGGGVSRKVNDNKERKRLKEILGGLEMPKGMSLIMRTNGVGRTKADITRDYNYLIRLWNQVRENTLKSSAPALVYEEGNVITRSLRDLYQPEFEEVVVSGEDSFKIAKEFMKMMMPTHVKKVVKHEDKAPIFQKYGIEAQLSNMNDPIVPLPSGGYIVINSTEALIAVDVNSGRSTGERNVEDMATNTNVQAAEEVARQLRLRDLAGLVVIDFIDMLGSRHRRQVENALKAALKSDRAKIQVGRISPFGLLEMSRQRLRSSLTEMNMIECPSCKGVGIIRSADSAVIQILRTIEGEIAQSPNKVTKAILTTSPELALHFLNHQRKAISELEALNEFELTVETEHMTPATFKIQLEWADGNRSRIFASDDREGRLPQSLEGGKPKRKRGGKKAKGNRDRDDFNNKERNDNNRNSSNDDAKVVEPKITENSKKADEPVKTLDSKAESDAPDFSSKGDGKAKDNAGKSPAPAKEVKAVKVEEKAAPEVKEEAKPAKKVVEKLPPENVIIDESTTKKKKKTGGWWKKIVE